MICISTCESTIC